MLQGLLQPRLLILNRRRGGECGANNRPLTGTPPTSSTPLPAFCNRHSECRCVRDCESKNRLSRAAPSIPGLTLSAWIVVSAAPRRVRNSSFSSSSSSSAIDSTWTESGTRGGRGRRRWSRSVGGLRDTSCLHSSYWVGKKRHPIRNNGVDVKISCRMQSSNITDGKCTGRGGCRHTCMGVNGIIPQGR